MKTGRPPAWLLEPAGPTVVGQEVAELDDDDRIVLPARLRAGLEWLGGDALGVLERPGRVRLLPWTASDRALERRRELLLRVADVARPPSEELELVRALEDRFFRLAVRTDGRVRLHGGLRLHLQAGIRYIVVVRFPNEIELWSPEYRNKRNEETSDIFSDLL